MVAASESAYRAARRAFIAACEAAGVDSIARLHPARDKDGKPLFMDCAALGPRLATRAVLVIASDRSGSAIMTRTLQELVPLPEDTRLVLIHALDPAAFAGVPADPGWPAAMLQAVATEDLSRVKLLGVLPLGGGDLPALPPLPPARIVLLPPATDSAGVAAALTAVFKN
jgi:hypothetical protein